MSDSLSSMEVLNAVENIKSTVVKCLQENLLLMETLRNVKSTKSYQISNSCDGPLVTSSDSPDMNQSKKPCKVNLNSKLSHKEHLSMMIKKVEKENLKLRESNIKLKQESKIQDKKIYDLNHKIMLHEKKCLENESVRVVIRDLKRSVDKKAAEIALLKQNLENVKTSMRKQKNKAKHFEEIQNDFCKSKTNLQFKCKMEDLLHQIDILLTKENEANKSYFHDKKYADKILDVVKKLWLYYCKLNEDKEILCKNFDNYIVKHFIETREICITRGDISVQIPRNTV